MKPTKLKELENLTHVYLTTLSGYLERSSEKRSKY
jgi:hypothetical protein